MNCKYGVPYVTVAHCMQGKVVAKRCKFSTVWSRLLSGGALDCHSYCCIFTHRFMVMVVIEFGSLKELTDAADNYHANINKLWPINSACVGHRPF